MILFRLFWSFLQIGAFSIGGGYAAMPLIQEQVVRSNPWLSMQEFTNLVTIAEMTPGPIAINAATFVGNRVAGFPGALVATFGCIFPSLILVSMLSFIYSRYKKLSILQSILAGLRPAVVALIASAGVSILTETLFDGNEIHIRCVQWFGAALFCAAFILLRKWKWNPILVMLLCGAGSLLYGIITQI